jgi:NTP pyrophosphatase (non-canonical NTP hydrolase)
MDFKTYDEGVAETAIYPASGEFSGLLYTVIALCGETGEIANKVKKVIRDDHNVLHPDVQAQLVDELGDVLWYLTRMAAELDVSLDQVADANLTKIRRRLAAKKIHGSGDAR